MEIAVKEKEISCPECGRRTIYTKIKTQERVCRHCGKVWRIEDEQEKTL